MKENSRVKITVLLDDESLKTIREYGYENFGSTNVSKALMAMVKTHGQKDKEVKRTNCNNSR